MTDATKLIAGLLLIAVSTIEFGGTFLLSIFSGKHSEFTEFQRSMFRAGHAHAGVLVQGYRCSSAKMHALRRLVRGGHSFVAGQGVPA